MFDYVKCEIPLPDGWEATELQTKDLDCEMALATIRADGRLVIERFDHEVVPKHERPFPDAPPGDLRGMCGMLRRVNERIVDLDYHGHLNFYGTDSEGVWHEYNAKFTDGVLVSISSPSPEIVA